MGTPADDQLIPTSVMTDYMSALRRYVGRNVPYDDIDDVLQEVMLRLHQRQTEEPIDNMTGYVFQIAASVMTDRARRSKVRHDKAHDSFEAIHHGIEQITPERVLIGREQISRLAVALSDMPERERDVFVLHRFEHMTYAEIAEHLGISISLVGKDMMKALKFLVQRDLP